MFTPNMPGVQLMQALHVGDTLIVSPVAKHLNGCPDMPPVFATAFMVGFMEWACVEAMRPHLQAGEHSIGTHVNLSHMANAPTGMNVTAFVELTEIAGRKFTFHVTCRDEAAIIGEGTHERVVIA